LEPGGEAPELALELLESYRGRYWAVAVAARMADKRLGLQVPEGGVLSPKSLRVYREAYVATMRAYNAGEGERMRSWNLPFLIRHSAFQAMDHAWEM